MKDAPQFATIGLTPPADYIEKIRSLLISGGVQLGARPSSEVKQLQPTLDEEIERYFSGLTEQSPVTAEIRMNENGLQRSLGVILFALMKASDRAKKGGRVSSSPITDDGLRNGIIACIGDEFLEGIVKKYNLEIIKKLLVYHPISYIADLITEYYIHTTITPSTIQYFALANPRDPKGAIERYIASVTELLAEYKDSDIVTPSVIREIVQRNPQDPRGAIERYIASVTELLAEYKDSDIVTPSVIREIVRGNPRDPKGAVKRYIASVTELLAEYKDSDIVTPYMIKRLALRHPQNPKAVIKRYIASVTELLAEYKDSDIVTPYIIKRFALTEPQDPRGAIERYIASVTELLAEYKNSNIVTPHIIKKLVITHPLSYAKKIKEIIRSVHDVLRIARSGNYPFITAGGAKLIVGIGRSDLSDEEITRRLDKWRQNCTIYPRLSPLSLLYVQIKYTNFEDGLTILTNRLNITFPLSLDAPNRFGLTQFHYSADTQSPMPEEELVKKESLSERMISLIKIAQKVGLSDDDIHFLLNYILAIDDQTIRVDLEFDYNMSWQNIEAKGEQLILSIQQSLAN
ncbi:hypothetical protein KC726_04925 [Candidatus Woesebacteria bacterium]|nr:hypothetical protein [Candidatus Woesebacteria bacterium]